MSCATPLCKEPTGTGGWQYCYNCAMQRARALMSDRGSLDVTKDAAGDAPLGEVLGTLDELSEGETHDKRSERNETVDVRTR